jgi:hypothetical protein
MIAAGVFLSVWGGPRRPALGAAVFAALGGAAVCVAGLTTSVLLLAGTAAAFFLFLSLVAGSSQVVWQRAVPPELQGRVFSVRVAIALSAIPLASLVAGPLADRLFEPAMMPGGALAAVFARSSAGEGKGHCLDDRCRGDGERGDRADRGLVSTPAASGYGGISAGIRGAHPRACRRLKKRRPLHVR